MKYCSTIFIACIFSWSLCAAQTGTLSGVVKTTDGIPVEAASVTIEELNTGAITDKNGRYAIHGIPYGTYHLVVSSLQLNKTRLTVRIRRTAETATVIAEPKGDTQLDEVAVEQKSVKRELETQGFAVAVVETKEASLRNLTTNELLDRAVGVRVRQNGGLGSSVTYNLNGMTGGSVGVFIDGLEISTYGSSFNLNNIPPAMIARIEVYKGVLPAHLSGDLLGGAINVVLKKGSGIRNNITAAVSYGSFNTLQSDVSGAYRNKKSGLTFRGSAFQAYTDNNYKIWGRFVRLEMPNGRMEPIETRRFNDAFRTFGGRFEIGFTDVKWADNAMLGYNGSDAYNEIQHGQYMTRPYKGRFTESQAHVFSLNYAKRDLFTKGLQLTFNGVYSDRDQYVQDTVTYNYTWLGELHRGLRFNNDGSVDTVPTRSPFGAQQGTPTMANINRKIINLRSNLNYDITPNHRLVFNHVFYTVDREDTDALRTVLDMSYRATNDLNKHVFSFAHEMNAFDQRLKTNLFGKFYQQQIDRINPYQATVNGVSTRVIDTIRNTKTTTGFGLAVSYAITPTIILIGSGERAVRMPAEGEIFGGPAENVTANPALRPEISDNLNLGARLGTFNINRHHLSVGFSGFVRNTKDQIMQRTDDRLNEATQTSPFVNLGKAQAIGFEAEMNYVYHQKLNFNFNISKFNSLFKMRETVHYNKQVPNLPFFTMNGTAQYHIDHVLQQKSRLNLYYNFGYVDSFNITWDEVPYSRTPTQFIQDFGASYMFPNSRFLVSVDVKNFTNRAAFDNFAVQKPGRAFYLKLNYTINHF